MTIDKKRELMNLSETNDFTDSESESDSEPDVVEELKLKSQEKVNINELNSEKKSK